MMQAPTRDISWSDFKDQVLLVLLARLGGTVTIPVAEVDGTGNMLATMAVDQEKQTFTFHAGSKQ